jgi:hypothetical protein
MLELLIGIVLTIWGAWAILAAILNKKSHFFMFYQNYIVFKWIFGNSSDRVINLVSGVVWLIIGFIMLSDYFGI